MIAQPAILMDFAKARMASASSAPHTAWLTARKSAPAPTSGPACGSGFGFTIPATWFQAVNPFLIFAFTPLILALWKRQADRGREPSTPRKMAYGCLGNAAAYLIMWVAAVSVGDGKASWLWLFAYFVVITLGELYLSPTSLSLVTKIAPASIVSLMMGMWLATSFAGNFLAGWLGSYWSTMDKPDFFLMIAAVGALAALLVWLIGRPLGIKH